MRGLSRELAIAGHDYFEVVFHYRAADPANDVIARTSWELYRDARVTGVRGKGGEGDTNYGYTAVYGAGTNVAPAADTSGAAILFVGKKTDRTLLAVGRLASTKLIGGADGPATSISVNTASVTFNVSALKSGIDVAGCDFFTDANYSGTPGDVNVSGPNTLRESLSIYGKTFPLYKLRVNSDTYARYNFALDGDTFTSYENSIILAGAGSYGKRQPRFPVSDGGSQKASLRLDNNTIIEPVLGYNTVSDPYNPVIAPSYFINSVRVKFNTAAGTLVGSAFAFIFEIPVYALTARTATEGNTPPGTWYIRPSYDSYFLDLDNGLGAAGGAVLMGMGEIIDTSGYVLRTIIPPYKYLYPYNTTNAGPDNENKINRKFNVDGLVVELLRAGDPPTSTTPNPTYINLTDPNLSFEIGWDAIEVGDRIAMTLYGIQYVTVKYFHAASNINYEDTFIIICDNATHDYDDIPDDHYLVIDDRPDVTGNLESWFNGFFSGPSQHGHTFGGGPGVFVVIAAMSFDFPQIQLQRADNPFVVIVVASRYRGNDEDSVTLQPTVGPINLGRSNASGVVTNGAFNNWGNVNAYYFGRWPFNARLRAPVRATGGVTVGTYDYANKRPVIVSGTPRYVYETSPFTLNAGGPLHAGPGNPAEPALDPIGGTNPPAGYMAYFLQSRQGGSVYNIQYSPEPEFKVYNRRWLCFF
jgi:hypothetical protein